MRDHRVFVGTPNTSCFLVKSTKLRPQHVMAWRNNCGYDER
jgi:hypothetical protein